jgi:hypothetical protein
MSPGEHPNTEAQRQVRRGKALELRKAGKSYRQIAAELSIDVETAYRDLQACFLELKGGRESIEELRDLELARLDRYLAALELSITGAPSCEECGRSDVKPIEAAVRISKRRGELKGLDAPTKHQEVPAEKHDKAKLVARAKQIIEQHERDEAKEIH